MELRSGYIASSADSTPPHGDGVPALAESAIPPDPSQLSATQALQMLDSDVYDDTELLAIADTLISLGAPPTHRPPPLPVPHPLGAHSAPTPAVTGGGLEDSTVISAVCLAAFPRANLLLLSCVTV